MTAILLVDDEELWQDILRSALPQYRVDVAGSYPEALALLSSATLYEVAVVDLDLVPARPDSKIHFEDRLGKGILGELRDHYPAIRRVALTGSPREIAEDILGEYAVDTILFKKDTSLEKMRAAVEVSVEFALTDIPAEVREAVSALGERFSRWKKRHVQHFDQIQKRLNNEIKEAQRRGQPGKYYHGELATRKTEREKFQHMSSEFIREFHNIRSLAQVEDLVREFENLKASFGGDETD